MLTHVCVLQALGPAFWYLPRLTTMRDDSYFVAVDQRQTALRFGFYL